MGVSKGGKRERGSLSIRSNWVCYKMWPVGIGLAALGIILVMATEIGGHSKNSSASREEVSGCPGVYTNWIRGPLRLRTNELFVPPMPVSASVCRYDGPSSLPVGVRGEPERMRLTDSGEIFGSGLEEFIAALNAAPRGYMRCPYNPWSIALVRFRYTEGPDVQVFMGIAGCWNASNGAIDARVQQVVIPKLSDASPHS